MKQQNILQSIGLDAKTESVYRALLHLADATAFRVAKESGIKRTSIYHILDNLLAMGLVSSYVSRGVTRYAAEHPQKIKSFFEEKMILAERLIPELQKEINKSKGKTSVRLLEGIEGIKSISDEMLASKAKTILSIGSSKKYLEFVGGKFGYGERRRKAGIFTRAIRYKGDEAGTNSKFQEVRIVPANFEFSGFITIYGKYVGIVLFEGNGFGLVVTSESLSAIMRSFFEVLWAASPAALDKNKVLP